MLSIYRAPKSQCQSIISSLPILLCDGTESVNNEYQHIVKAWRKVNLSKEGLEYQWEDGLYQGLDNFRNAKQGNTTKTFLQLFDLLQSKQIQKNITIIFISDGLKQIILNQLSEKIKLVTNKYLIQFITIEVGNDFPKQIGQNLKQMLHNQNQPCVTQYFFNRTNNKGSDRTFTFFLETFKTIKSSLAISSIELECDKQVQQTLVSQPTRKILTDSLFVAQSPVKINGQTLQPITFQRECKQIIVNSINLALINYESHLNKQTLLQEFELIQNFSKKFQNPNNGESEDIQFQTIENLVNFIQNREQQINQASKEKLLKSQVNQANAQTQTQELIEQIIIRNENIIDQDQKTILSSFQSEIDQIIKPSQQEQLQKSEICLLYAQIIKQTILAIKNSLQVYEKKLEKEKPKDCKKLLKEFYDFIQIKLNDFDKLDPEYITEEISDEALALNQLLEVLAKLDLLWFELQHRLTMAVQVFNPLKVKPGRKGQSFLLASESGSAVLFINIFNEYYFQMLNSQSKKKLQKLFLKLEEFEVHAESLRQILCQQDDFDPYAVFKKKSKQGYLDDQDPVYCNVFRRKGFQFVQWGKDKSILPNYSKQMQVNIYFQIRINLYHVVMQNLSKYQK